MLSLEERVKYLEDLVRDLKDDNVYLQSRIDMLEDNLYEKISVSCTP